MDVKSYQDFADVVANSTPDAQPSIQGVAKRPATTDRVKALIASTDKPLYCLPNRVIKVLSQKPAKGRQLLSAEQIATELAFARLCESTFAIGYWQGQPLELTSAFEQGPYCDPEYQQIFRCTDRELRAYKIRVENAVRHLKPIRIKIRGYLGFLLTHPDFLREFKVVEAAWMTLPNVDRPKFPLTHVLARRNSKLACAFHRQLCTFLMRWNLCGLVTFDLPKVQGPLCGVPVSTRAFPKEGVVSYQPTFCDDPSIQREIKLAKLSESMRMGHGSTLFHIGHLKAFATYFEILHIERAIRARFERIPWGLVDLIEKAIAAHLNMTQRSVERCRIKIRQRRAGRKSLA